MYKVLKHTFRFWAFCHERDPGWAGYLTLQRLHGNLSLRLTGLPYLTDRATRLGGSPHLSCKRHQNKIRYFMDRRVTPPRRVTSPTRGPPLSCKQALSTEFSWKILKCELQPIALWEISTTAVFCHLVNGRRVWLFCRNCGRYCHKSYKAKCK